MSFRTKKDVGPIFYRIPEVQEVATKYPKSSEEVPVWNHAQREREISVTANPQKPKQDKTMTR
eukprot:3287937-Amphidinium_carterae.1